MDLISDLLIRIKNAQRANLDLTELPFSKLNFAIAKILEREGFLSGVERKGAKTKEKIEIKLKYADHEPAIQDLKRISKVSRRVYIAAHEIRTVKQGYGLAIISTSKGLMTDKEAKKAKLGGEILCEIW